MHIKAALTKVKLARKLFILDIEQRTEAWIPNELAIGDLPTAFWYYDDIIQSI